MTQYKNATKYPNNQLLRLDVLVVHLTLPHPPKQGTSPLKTTPLSPCWGLHLGSVVFFSNQRKIADAFGDKFGNGIMALSAFLGGFACAFGLGSLDASMDGWMDMAGGRCGDGLVAT